jgi:hypothetical protein
LHFLFSGTNGGSYCGFPMTRNPTAEWLARQITEAFPWNSAPKYLIRDNDRAFGVTFNACYWQIGWFCTVHDDITLLICP